MMKYLLFAILSFIALANIEATNLIPDPSFENGYTSGGNDDYYVYNGNYSLWRAWPQIGFEIDTETMNSGLRSLKIVHRDYGTDYTPSFRSQAYPSLEANSTYTFSFYYKTDLDRSSTNFNLTLKSGTQESNAQTIIKDVSIAIDAAAKDGFVLLSVEFETTDAVDAFTPYIQVPFMDKDASAFYHMDDVSLIKKIETKKAWAPSPADESEKVSVMPTLSWQAGITAVKRNVYFGNDINDLQEVATDITSLQFTPTNELEYETTYYWRVDEIESDNTTHTGDVWSFTTVRFYDVYMDMIKTQSVDSDNDVNWKQFGPGNSGFVNFLRYHPTRAGHCMTSPDMHNTYQTEDNGASWYTVRNYDESPMFSRLYDMFYSTKDENFGIGIECARLFTSNDMGKTWDNVKNCPWYTNNSDGDETRSWHRKVSAVGLDPTDDNTWYVGEGNFCRGQQHLWSCITGVTGSNPTGNENSWDSGTWQGKIWKTTNAGETWTEVSTGLDDKAQFSRIIIHPENNQLVFAGSQIGLYKSTDGGTNWTNISDGQLDNGTIMDMDYYYNATSGKFILYVADQVRYYPDGQTTKCDGGIFKSTDNGETWTNINGDLGLDINQLSGGVPDNYYQYIGKWFDSSQAQAKVDYPTKPTAALQYFNSLNVDQSQEDVLYVGFYDAQIQYSITPGRLWQTLDGGSHWTNIARDFGPAWEADKAYWESRNNPYNDNMEEGHSIFNQQWSQNYPLRSLRYCSVSPVNGDIMLLYAHNTFLSTDKGVTFKQVDETYTASGNIMGNGNSNLPGQCLWQDKRLGENVAYFGSGEHHLWKSTNDGVDGKQAAQFLPSSHESVFSVVTHPWDENTVYTTSMRQHDLDRIYKSTDAGESFEDWGRATLASEWMRTNMIRIDPINPNNMYFGVTEVAGSGGGSGTDGPDKDKEGGFHKSTNGGKTFDPSNSGMPDKVWVHDIEFDPRDDTRASLFAAAPWNKERRENGGLYHSTDRGETWTEIEVASNLEGINSVTFDYSGRLYVSAGRREANVNNGGLFYSDDYGTTWTQIFDAPYVQFVDVSPFNRNVLTFSMGELTKNPGVFMSFDRGKTWSKNNHVMGQPDNITQVEFDLHDVNLMWVSVMGSGFYRGTVTDGDDLRKITASPGTGILNTKETLQIEAATSENLGTLQYISDNPSVATVDSDGLVTAVKRGAVKIWVTSEDGVYSDFVYLVIDGDETSVKDKEQNNAISIFPNPAKIGRSVRIVSEKAPIDNVKIYTLAGQVILMQNAYNKTTDINTNQLSAGTYIIRVQAEKYITSKKLIITN